MENTNTLQKQVQHYLDRLFIEANRVKAQREYAVAWVNDTLYANDGAAINVQVAVSDWWTVYQFIAADGVAVTERYSEAVEALTSGLAVL